MHLIKKFIFLVFLVLLQFACNKKEIKVEKVYNQENCEADKNRFKASLLTVGPKGSAFILRDCVAKLKDAEAIALKKDAEVKAFIVDVQDKEIPVEMRIGMFNDFRTAYFNESVAFANIEKQLKKEYEEKQRKLAKMVKTPSKAELLASEKSRLADARKRGVYIGMTRTEVLESSWGKPDRINRTTTSYGRHEQWIYGVGNYLYFEDGILTAIQN